MEFIYITFLVEHDELMYIDIPIQKKIERDDIEECVAWALWFKRVTGISPYGYVITKYDSEECSNLIDKKNYYFNAEIIEKYSAPFSWRMEQIWNITKKVLFLKNKIVIPYDETKDTIININI